jgi:hypothetical protein
MEPGVYCRAALRGIYTDTLGYVGRWVVVFNPGPQDDAVVHFLQIQGIAFRILVDDEIGVSPVIPH